MNNVTFLLATILGVYLCMVGFSILLVRLMFPWKTEHGEGSIDVNPAIGNSTRIVLDQRQKYSGKNEDRDRSASKRKSQWRNIRQTAIQR